MVIRPIACSISFALTVLSLSCAGTPTEIPPEEEQGSASLDVVSALFDTDGDGHVGRYEAAAAALLLVDQAGDPNPDGASNDQIARVIDRLLAATTRGGTSDDPLTFEVEGNQAIAAGVVDARSPGRFLEVVLGRHGVDEIVLARVSESVDPESLALLLRLVETSGIATRVPSDGVAAGAGAELLAAGTRRYVEPGARVGLVGASGQTRWLSGAEIEERSLRTEAHGLTLVPTGTTASLRGLSAVNASIAWATGNHATVMRTVDGGASWTNLAPASIAGLDVRDVYALSADVAWIMTAGPATASRILFTADGGVTWTEQHRETATEAFLDGFDFWEPGRGVCYGDPMADGRFRVLLTGDGKTWTPIESAPAALEGGEASFAGSGTGVRVLGLQRGWIVTGGTDGTSRVFSTEDGGTTWSTAETPLAAPKPGAGAFSVSFATDGRGVLVGGDYLQRDVGGAHVAAWSADFGETWKAPDVGPRGQRAGSVAVNGGMFLATGQTGTDISRDGGRTWRPFSSEGFHCVDVSPIDGTIWFAGAEGRAAKIASGPR